MKTTFKEILAKNPCGQKGRDTGWQKLIGYYKPESFNKEISIKEILKSNGIKDAVWALRCIEDKEDLNKVYLFCADVAESVLDIFENKYPEDKRPREAIEAIRLFVDGKINIGKLNSAASAASAARAAASNVFSSSAAAARAAASATVFSSYSSSSTAFSAVSAAVFSSSSGKDKWVEIKNILLKYI